MAAVLSILRMLYKRTIQFSARTPEARVTDIIIVTPW